MAQPFRIAAERCATCIFSPDSPIGPERMRDLHELWQAGGHQICHHFGHGDGEGDFDDDDGIIGEDVCCRGFFETQIPDKQRELILALAELGSRIVEMVPLAASQLDN